ncbi:recombinase family protein [Caproiciproducens sp. R2]|uniref:recombinase family protein n=1 Tax=Caproiciproducens sp. R2 TaxID=3435187 RepID=UPI0040344C90
MTKARTITKEIYVAIYLRLSRDDQNGNTESMSISNQRDMLMAYCKERGWNIYDIYVDDGFTGTNFERPGFQRMIGDIEEGYVSVVLTKDLSRLGRNYVMTGQYTDFFFPEHGVRYVAVNDSYDSAKEDNDIAPFKNILNEMYAKDISKKIRSARQISAKQGKFMGSKPPFGYVKSPEDKHLLIIDPPAAEIIKRLFREFAAGESGRNIATKLNTEGVDTPADYYFKQTRKRATRSDTLQQWGSGTILQLLRNQVYIGDMVQCKRKVSSFKTKKRLVTNPDAWVIVEGTHEPIIDRFTWECVQRRLDKTKRQSPCNSIRATRSGDINVFSGIIRCADCGAAMAFNERVNKSGTKYRFYRCSRYANSGSKSCSMHFMDADTLESIILSDIQFYAQTAVTDEKKLMDRLLSFSGRERQNEKAAQGKALRDATNRISFLEDASKRLFEEKIAGNVPESLFRKMLSDYESELSELEAKAEDIRQSTQEEVNSESDVKNWIKLIKECVSINSLDRATAFQLIDHVDVHEQTDEDGHKSQSIQVKYNFVGVLS